MSECYREKLHKLYFLCFYLYILAPSLIVLRDHLVSPLLQIPFLFCFLFKFYLFITLTFGVLVLHSVHIKGKFYLLFNFNPTKNEEKMKDWGKFCANSNHNFVLMPTSEYSYEGKINKHFIGKTGSIDFDNLQNKLYSVVIVADSIEYCKTK